jgi:hypothetical protein
MSKSPRGKPRLDKLVHASPVWADMLCRDFEVIKRILRETNPDSYPAINRSAEKIAEIVDVEIGEDLHDDSDCCGNHLFGPNEFHNPDK